MLRSALEYIEGIVEAQGPEPQDYNILLSAFDVIAENASSHKVWDESGVAEHQAIENFFHKYRSIFRTPSSMQGFAFSKPNGYAGDFELIERIYDVRISNKPSLLRWDRFFHSGSAPRAVRNRAVVLAEVIARKLPSSLLSVGCGPAIDICNAFISGARVSEVALLDNDALALRRAEVNIRSRLDLPDRLEFYEQNALRFKGTRKFDVIWSSGLFDYLRDKTFIALMRRLKSQLSAGGELVIGNFSVCNPERGYMEAVGKWMLHHRTKDHLVTMAVSSGFAVSKIDVSSDDTGVNLFLHCSG